MTDNSLISQFFENEATDSQFTLDEVVAAAKETYGIDIRDQFCLFTGKPIGRTFDSELEFALSEETCDDIEDLADAMMVRIVASMRPSPALNKPDVMTLQALAAKSPLDAMMFFVNRLNGNRDLLTKRDGHNSFSPLLARINDYKRWEQLVADGLDLAPWTHWLAELDAKMNLHDLKAPRISVDRLNRMFVSFDGVSLFSFVTIENHKDVYKMFEKWVFGQLGVYEQRDRVATSQANWHRGNKLAVTTYTRSWIENPEVAKRASDASRKHGEALKNLKVSKRESEKAVKPAKPQTAKALKLSNAKSLLDSILSGNAPATPKPAVETPKPMMVSANSPLGKLKLNLVRKG